jgi:serine/threonine protein kinase/Tfp pilus assembly protein PilF
MDSPGEDRMRHVDYWERVEQIYHDALALAPTERAFYLREAGIAEPDVIEMVESLLKQHEQLGSFLDSPACEVLSEVGAARRSSASRQATDEDQSLIGTIISHYRIERPIPGGGMGRLYLAHDTQLGGPVALKLLPPEYTNDEERLWRFKQEARAARALNHPSILTIYELGEEQGVHFIAAEYVEGISLRERMSAGPLALEEAVKVASQVAEALEAVHRLGIVHRDIKPENIMLRPDGIVKVLDFGIAKLTDKGSIHSDPATQLSVETGQGIIIGTPMYMSPEQVRGLNVDARTDIFSLGVVLYEMIAGRMPFEGETNSEVIASILKEEPQPLTQYSSKVPGELAQLVYKALRKNREERFQTADDLALKLHSIVGTLERAEHYPQRTLRPKDEADGRLPNPLWASMSIILVGVTICLSVVISRRFLNNGPDVPGVFVTIAVALLSLFAASAFTQSGKQWSERGLSRMGMKVEVRGKVQTAVALVILLVVTGLYFSLPVIARIYNNKRAVQFQEAGDLHAAILNYQRAVSLDPDYAAAHYNLATAYEDVLQFDRASAEYESALSADPKFYFAYNNLARLYLFRLKDYAGALKILNAALELKPEEPQVRYSLYKNRGWAHFGLGFYDLAAEDLMEALRWRQDGAAAHCLLAQVLEAQKKESNATQEWEACVAYAPGEIDVDATWLSLAQERLRQEK